MFPKVPKTVFTEEMGVIHVAWVVNSAQCLWRPTSLHDVGIDGQIEYVADGEATGRMVLVQVKSGESYFSRRRGSYVEYWPSKQHANYWEAAPLPVILVLCNLDHEICIWTDARDSLRSGRGKPILVHEDQHFDTEGVLSALQAEGPLPIHTFDPQSVLRYMIAERNPSSDFPLDFFDLFFQGMSDMGTSLYFGMDLVMTIAESKICELGDDFGVGLGSRERDFLDRYIAFLVALDLARVDFDWFSRMRREQELVGHFIAPLTRRGLAIKKTVGELQKKYGKKMSLAQERYIRMEIYDGGDAKTEAIEHFKREFENE